MSPLAPDSTLPSLLDELAANAWPAEVTQRVDGWLLRAHRGVTRRANSVLTCDRNGCLPLEEKVALAEAFYARHGMPARFQVSPGSQPPDLDARLEARGYAVGHSPALVQLASLPGVVAASAGSEAQVTVMGRLEDEWLATYAAQEREGDPDASIRGDILRRIGPPAGFALVWFDGEPAAVGLGVAERGWVGIFCMATRPEFRRRGAGTAVLHALARWGQEQSAGHAYLQVVEGNAPATALYARAGFATLYRDHYRERSV